MSNFVHLGNDPFVKQYQGIVLNIVARYSTGINDYDDLVSAGMYGMMLAKSTFKKSKKCSMGTWVYTMARSEIQKAKNSEVLVKISPETARKKKISLSNIDDYTLNASDDNDPSKIMMEKELDFDKTKRYADLWLQLNKKYNKKERLIIIDYYCFGLTMGQIDLKYKTSCCKLLHDVRDYLRRVWNV